MKALTTSTRGAADPRYELNQHYDVRSCRNGLIVGSVRYSFHDGVHFCIAIQLHADLPAWARSVTEFGPFDMHEGEAPWGMPVAPAPAPGHDAADPLPMLTDDRAPLDSLPRLR